MTIKTVTIHVYAQTAEHDKPGSVCVYSCDLRGSDVSMRNLVWLQSQEIEINLPDTDLRQAQIDQLEAEVQAERAQSQSRVNLLLDRISKLQAIGHDE